jgi:hypothetical protein
MAMRLKQTAFLSTLSAVAVLMCAKPVHAKNLFVTTTGSDAVTWALNDASHAWRTLAKAGLEAKAGDTVFIGAGSYTTPLVVANSGTSSTPIVFRAGSTSATQKVYLEGVGVVLSGKSYVTIQGLNIRNVPSTSSTSGIGIVVEANRTTPSQSSLGIVLTGNTISNTYSSAIGVWGAHPSAYPYSVGILTISANTIEGACNGGWNEAITVARGVSSFYVRNNIVRNSLNVDRGGEGIDVKDGARNGEISGNVLTGLRRNAIYVDGGFPTGAPDANLPATATRNIRIFNNRVYGNLNYTHGITVVAEGRGSVDGVYIYNNLVYRNSGIGINLYRHPAMVEGTTIKNVYVINNSLADNGQIRNEVPLNQAPWFGNIEVSNGDDSQRATPRFQGIYIRNNATQMSPSFTNAIRGIFVGNLTAGQVFVSNNSDLNVQDDTDNRVEIFTNAPAGDLTLRAGASAINAGVAVAPYTNTDILGTARPLGGGIDLGAYELY